MAPRDVMLIERSGGIAGFHDVVEIAVDGTARVTTRNGGTRSCTVDPAVIDALRAIDFAAVGSGPPKVPIADGFTYVIASCLAGVSGSALPEM